MVHEHRVIVDGSCGEVVIFDPRKEGPRFVGVLNMVFYLSIVLHLSTFLSFSQYTGCTLTFFSATMSQSHDMMPKLN